MIRYDKANAILCVSGQVTAFMFKLKFEKNFKNTSKGSFKSGIIAPPSFKFTKSRLNRNSKYTHPGRYSISTYDDIVLEDSNISSGNRMQSEKIMKFNIS